MSSPISTDEIMKTLPGMDCGLCGARTCEDYALIVSETPAAMAANAVRHQARVVRS